MSKSEKAMLACYGADSEVKMVNKYTDSSGSKRVW
jgi:hypothetical protein